MSLSELINKIFKQKIKTNKTKNKIYPIEEFKDYLNTQIKVLYLDSDKRKEHKGLLNYLPNQSGFYLYFPNGQILLHWDFLDPIRKETRNAIYKIFDKDGNEIYHNDSVPYKVDN
jgi:hypothetical protein